MNEIQIFRSSDFGEVRTLLENGEVLFCGSDVARALGYTNPSKALADHCKGDLTNRYPITDALGRSQEAIFIPESDLYRLVFRSKLPSAEKFTDWVTNEVLPTIRKHGAYMTPETLRAALLNPDTVIQLCQQLKAEQDKRRELEVVNSTLRVDNAIMQPKADYFDELVERNTLTNFRETAKQLGLKEREFIRFLLERKYIYRDKRGKLLPYAEKGAGLFEVKECFNDKTQWCGTQTLVTPKGRETFRLLYPVH